VSGAGDAHDGHVLAHSVDAFDTAHDMAPFFETRETDDIVSLIRNLKEG
jgi:hypothetical protein